MYVYIYIYIHTHIYIYTYIYTHIHTYINVSYEHRYVPERSRKGQYFFTYCMRMSMLGDGPQAHVLKSTLLYSNNKKFHVLHSHVRDGPQAHVFKSTLYIVTYNIIVSRIACACSRWAPGARSQKNSIYSAFGGGGYMHGSTLYIVPLYSKYNRLVGNA